MSSSSRTPSLTTTTTAHCGRLLEWWSLLFYSTKAASASSSTLRSAPNKSCPWLRLKCSSVVKKTATSWMRSTKWSSQTQSCPRIKWRRCSMTFTIQSTRASMRSAPSHSVSEHRDQSGSGYELDSLQTPGSLSLSSKAVAKCALKVMCSRPIRVAAIEVFLLS